MTTIQLRRGTASEWTSANPVLAAGEMGVELDTVRLKFGDGVKSWDLLEYLLPTSDVQDLIDDSIVALPPAGGGGYIGAWSNSVAYKAGSVVIDGGKTWGAKADVAAGQPAPAVGGAWDQLAVSVTAPVLVLGPSTPVPGGTLAGTVIVRTVT